MTERDYKKEEFRRMAFRCIEPTTVCLLDGSSVTVKADSYQSSNEKEWPNASERQKRGWKIYSITRDGQQALEMIDELELEQRMGTESFNQTT